MATPSPGFLVGHAVIEVTSDGGSVEGAVEFETVSKTRGWVLKCTDTGALLHERQSRASTRSLLSSILQSHHRSDRCRVHGAVLCSEASESTVTARVRLDVWLQPDTVTGLIPWERHRYTGDLFSYLIPATQATFTNSTVCPLCAYAHQQRLDEKDATEPIPINDGSDLRLSAVAGCPLCCNTEHTASTTAAAAKEQPWEDSDARQVLDVLEPPVNSKTQGHGAPFKLHECFEELPNWLIATSHFPPLPPSQQGKTAALELLPHEAIHRIACLADDTSALACTCRYLRAVASEVASGVLPTLHPHQRAALKRMVERERTPKPLQHPYVRRMRLFPDCGLHAYLDCASGELSTQEPVPVMGMRGGLFCDEPGLGKTVTALSLIVKTLGTLPEAPKGAHVRQGSFHEPYREVVGSFYMAPVAELMDEASVAVVAEAANGGVGAADGVNEPQEGTYAHGGPGGPPTPVRRGSTRVRSRAVVVPNTKKGREVAIKGIKMQQRNRALLEDLHLAPRGPSGHSDASDAEDSEGECSLGARMRRGRAQVQQKVAGCRRGRPPGFVTAEDGFVGEREDNVSHFRDAILRFAYEHDLGADSVAAMPTVQLLIGRLQPRAAHIAPPSAHTPVATSEPGRMEDEGAEAGQEGDDNDGGGGGELGPRTKDEGACAWPPLRVKRRKRTETGGRTASTSRYSSSSRNKRFVGGRECSEPPKKRVRRSYNSYGLQDADMLSPDEQKQAADHQDMHVAHCKRSEDAASERDGEGKRGAVADEVVTGVICRPSGNLKIRPMRTELSLWAKAHICRLGGLVPSSKEHADTGLRLSHQLLTVLGLTPVQDPSKTPKSAQKPAVSGCNSNDDDSAAEEPTLTPSTAPRASWSSGSPFGFPARDCWNQEIRYDSPALAKALTEAVEAHRRHRNMEPVMLSGATLIVVPAILVEHWKHEIAKHVQHAALKLYCLEDAKSANIPAHHLAWDYDVVLTTFTHLSSYGAAWQLRNREARHVILQVRWLRVILDEGHILGGKVQTNRLSLLCALRAERRWVMTGTPTPQTGSRHVTALGPLLGFLRCHPFCGDEGSKLWEDTVCTPFDNGCLPGKQRLKAVLQEVMIRSSKAGVAEARLLPRCTKEVVRLPFDPDHEISYNALVEVVVRNLLLADWFDEGHVESILNPKRSKFASELLSNMRLSCSVAGQCHLEPNIEHVLEALQMLAEAHGMPVPQGPPEVDPHVPLSHPLARIEAALRSGSVCDSCSEATKMPMVTPCAHVLCVDCAAHDSVACRACGTKYVQQPVDDPARKKHNSRPKAEVPQDLIELQPVFHQRGAVGKSGGEWQPTWQATQSTKCDYLIQKLRDLGIAPPLPEVRPSSQAEEGSGAGQLRPVVPGSVGLPGGSEKGDVLGAQTGPELANAQACRMRLREATVQLPLLQCQDDVPAFGDVQGAFSAAPGACVSKDGGKRSGCGDSGAGQAVHGAGTELEACEGTAQGRTGKHVAFLPGEVSHEFPVDDMLASAVVDSFVMACGKLEGPTALRGPRVTAAANSAADRAARRSSGDSSSLADAEMPCLADEDVSLSPDEVNMGGSPASADSNPAVDQEALQAQPMRLLDHCSNDVEQVDAVMAPAATAASVDAKLPRRERQACLRWRASSKPRRSILKDTSSIKARSTAPGWPSGLLSSMLGREASHNGKDGTHYESIATVPGRSGHDHTAAASSQDHDSAQFSADAVASNSAAPTAGGQLSGPPARQHGGSKRGRRALEHAARREGAFSALLPTAVRQAEERRVAAEAAAAANVRFSAAVAPAADATWPQAIVFSAFWQHLLLVQQQLASAGVAFVVLKGGMDRWERARTLAQFRDGVARVLVMDSSGAVGLDLSFVEHVFLMEPLGDLALEQQIISRAHRLGATRPVHARVLVMQDSVEDDMVSVAHGQRTQTISEDAQHDTFVNRCRLECWAKVLGGGDSAGRPMRNLLLMSLKKIRHAAH